MNEFLWEPKIYDGFKETIIKEIFIDRIYEKVFTVDKNDIVFDIGASIGPFTFSILDKEPKLVYAFEPSFDEFITLVKNTNFGPVVHINKGIGYVTGEFNFDNLFIPNEIKSYSITFDDVIKSYNVTNIDMMKLDCEGCEYDIFQPKNLIWLKNHVKKITGEWHLSDNNLKNKFKEFRDVFLRVFNNYEIYSLDGVNIKWNLWSDDFINYYNEIIIHIDNR